MQKIQVRKLLSDIAIPLDELAPVVITGSISGFITLVMSVSFAALIFSGDLAVFVSHGINMAIATTIITGLCVSLLSQCRQAIAIPDDDTAPIIALMAALVAATIPASTSPADTLLTVIAAITFTAVITGLFLFLIGYFRLGSIIEYLPYSVMGGYFAGAGWLLIAGALKVATGLELNSLTTAQLLLEPTHLNKWFPALLIALAVYIWIKRNSKPVVLPLVVVIAVILFYAIAYLIGIPMETLMSNGWLLGPFPEIHPQIWDPLGSEDFQHISWKAIFSNLSSVGTILLLSAISILLTVSGLSLVVQRDLDVNHELKVAGLGNMFSGFFGGMLSFPSLSVSSLVASLGAPATRWTGIISVIFCVLVLYTGVGLLAYIPLPVLAFLLIFLGINFLYEWLIEARGKFTLLEYLVIPMILTIVATIGFLEGVFFGLVAAIILFAINYSQTKVVRYQLSGAQQKSNVERKPSEQKILRDEGDQMMILGLQGYLFFGTASKLYNRILARARNRTRDRLRYIVLDFSKVTGLDSSAASNFIKMSQLATRREFYLIVTGLNIEVEHKLHQGGFDHLGIEYLNILVDVDHGIEWCEERILQSKEREFDTSSDSFIQQIAEFMPSPSNIDIFLSYLTIMSVKAGFHLTRQGDLANELFFIESSAASVYIYTKEGEKHRVRRSRSGTVFGEVGFYLNAPRTASVITDKEGIVYSLSRKELERMEKENPEIASGLHKFMARLVTERLLYTTHTLEAVLK